jgi:RHS repeat-associated protein
MTECGDDAMTNSSGASYYRARYYDPTAGRFLSEDPSWGGEDEKPNFYVYASNEPVDRFDPSGLSDLYYSSKANILILEDGNGNFVAAYAVGNNVAPGSHNDDGVTLTQPYPPGVYNFGGYNPHPRLPIPIVHSAVTAFSIFRGRDARTAECIRNEGIRLGAEGRVSSFRHAVAFAARMT